MSRMYFIPLNTPQNQLLNIIIYVDESDLQTMTHTYVDESLIGPKRPLSTNVFPQGTV